MTRNALILIGALALVGGLMLATSKTPNLHPRARATAERRAAASSFLATYTVTPGQRADIRAFERRGLLQRDCANARAEVRRGWWDALPADKTRRGLVVIVAALCREAGHGDALQVYDGDGALVADFTGSDFVGPLGEGGR